MGGKQKCEYLHCRNLLLRHLGEIWDRSVAEMGDKGGKDAGPIVAALGVAALGWASSAMATLKARKLEEAHTAALEASKALQALSQNSRVTDPAGLHHQARGLTEKYKAAQQEYSRLLRFQPQA